MKKKIILVKLIILAFAGSLQAKVLDVKPGESIQKTINKAKSGDVIRIYPGTYHEFLYVDKPNIKIQGVIQAGKWPRLDGRGELNDGIIASGSGFHVENLHISNYKANGIMTQAANDVVIRRVMIDHTGIYGIYPTLGTNITIEDTVTWGIADAGIYVGMCYNADVRRNEVYENVSGIEIENSSNVIVEENTAYNNTAGILVFTLPGLPLKRSDNIIVRRNFVFNNNHKNFAARGAIVANIPPGVGMMLLSADNVVFEDNIIRDNSMAGLVIADKSVLPTSRKPDPDMDPTPDNTSIRRNMFFNNGKRDFWQIFTWLHFVVKTIVDGGKPPSTGGEAELFPAGADIIAIGKGDNNCILEPESLTRIGVKNYGNCDGTTNSSKQISMIGPRRPLVKTTNLGKQVYGAICSGCHTMNITRIGPPVTEIREKYASNPLGIIKFATNPQKIRAGYPQMPSQKYLGVNKLTEAAKFMLGDEIGKVN